MLTDRAEKVVFRKAYNAANFEKFNSELARLRAEGVDEKEARSIAKANADHEARDIADTALREFRSERITTAV